MTFGKQEDGKGLDKGDYKEATDGVEDSQERGDPDTK